MHEKVKEFLETQEKVEREKYQKQKQKTLVELGIYEKEYSPKDNFNTMDFPFYDPNTQNRYRKIPIEITDEEYEEVKKYVENPNVKTNSTYNSVASCLSLIAWIIFIAGIIASFVMIDYFFFGCLTITIISGMSMLGFAEIIKLLEAIKNK